MIACFQPKVTLPLLLEICRKIDEEVAGKIRNDGCPHCNRKSLNSAYYKRKPQGFPADKNYILRYSFCCSKEGCRKRVLPPSCIFFGRRVYWTGIFLVSVALRQLDGRTADQVVKLLEVPIRTLHRWVAFFRDEYLRSRQWLLKKSRLPPGTPAEKALGYLLGHFMSRGEDEVDQLQQFILFMTDDP